MSPLIFESIDEPNLVKPPIVQIAGVLRQLDTRRCQSTTKHAGRDDQH